MSMLSLRVWGLEIYEWSFSPSEHHATIRQTWLNTKSTKWTVCEHRNDVEHCELHQQVAAVQVVHRVRFQCDSPPKAVALNLARDRSISEFVRRAVRSTKFVQLANERKSLIKQQPGLMTKILLAKPTRFANSRLRNCSWPVMNPVQLDLCTGSARQILPFTRTHCRVAVLSQVRAERQHPGIRLTSFWSQRDSLERNGADSRLLL